MNIGRYRIIREIGRGSMGVVYQAEDPNLDIVVALKVLRQDRLTNEPYVRRFLSEAKALGRLDHPNIVRVFNVDRDGDTVYIAMEFIEGESLVTTMKRERFSPEKVARFGATIAEALDSAHRNGIVHRDVKPSNILFKGDGRVKITDFGIAHIEDPSAAEQTQAGEILGTPAYMSPEQVLSRPVDGRSDIFSLGIILYELATGARPFAGEGVSAIFNAITCDNPPEVLSVNGECPKALSDIIARCLEKEPERRFANGRDLSVALHGVAGEKKSEAADIPVSEGKGSHRLLIPGILIAAVLCALGSFYYFSSKGKTAPPPISIPANSVLSVESSPAGAQVFIDGALQGTAPLQARVTPGKHEVRLSMPNYYEWEAQVETKDKQTAPISVNLVPMNVQ